MKVLKISPFFFVSLVFLFFTCGTVSADSFVIIKSDGRILSNVLSTSDSQGLSIPQRGSLEIKEVANSDSDLNSQVSIEKMGDKISLVISSPEGSKQFDVTDWKENLVEIEEQAETQKLTIKSAGDKFKIEQGSISVETSFPLNVDPKSKNISVKTQSGERFLSIMPKEALTAVLRAKVISRISDQDSIQLKEESGKDLFYLISGQKEVNLFNMYMLPIDVKAKVSASTGEILFIDQPAYLRVLGFLIN